MKSKQIVKKTVNGVFDGIYETNTKFYGINLKNLGLIVGKAEE